MASTIKSDNGVSSGVTGIVQTADSTGQLALQTTTSGGVATTAVTIDNSQNVGIGVTPSAWSTGGYKFLQFTDATSAYVGGSGYAATIGANSYINNSSNWVRAGASYAVSQLNQFNGQFTFQQAAAGSVGSTITWTQAMTLDNSGNLLVGITSYVATNANYLALQTSGGNLVTGHASGTPSGYQYAAYLYNSGVIGSITQNGTTGVLYNLTSDYRLKNNPVPVTGAKDFVMALQPKTWDWWDGSGKGVGFIAHEFMEVAKYSGHGEKDATKEEEYEVTPAVKDDQGNITTPAVMGTRTVPVYQSIQPSSSEVMANLVAYIQELSAEVTALKAKIGV